MDARPPRVDPAGVLIAVPALGHRAPRVAAHGVHDAAVEAVDDVEPGVARSVAAGRDGLQASAPHRLKLAHESLNLLPMARPGDP